MPTKTSPKIYTVSQVNTLVKEVLEVSLPGRVMVRGEISGWKQHASGHCYFSLKDEGSVLPCAMWKQNFARVRFRPENGLAVIATGSISVYVPQGRYSLIVEEMTPEGVGSLQLAFEQLVRKLRAEGLFSDEHKKPIPMYPERIGILTSESGAAVHDIADSVHQRWPCTRLYLYPVPVQGEGAAREIAAAIADVNRRNKQLQLDLLIVGRGGGSLEDLWAFNEEVLARAIFASKIPIISAVGHEVDTTIADLVADRRASTPTKAGVVAVPDMHDVLTDLEHQANRLTRSVRSRIQLGGEYLQTILASSAFRNPLLAVRMREQYIDELASALSEAIRILLADRRALVQVCHEHIARIEPHRLLALMTLDLSGLANRARAAITAAMAARTVDLAACEGRLAALDPRSVLARGYTITTNKTTGRLVRTRADVRVGDTMLTELAGKNVIESEVRSVP
ncbi:MAG TPA: exodeoxyribonuclease VII large subunit [Sedimentisphaerales bacterium]|nr:exodeoxyribonuclease VII large subunit [Sedimentisphaerales bacterium]HRS09920.1 exodeoxyribonuclease VII large subunit [Sedimentisphaerales bacterium]HRV46430.1 exodeoxyribonuclease VII large subunit [Sedimentisphaerales bacterium]